MTDARAVDVAGGDRPLDARSLSRLRWRCRRGLLENDLLLERWFREHPAPTVGEADGLEALMALDDPQLLDLLMGRVPPDGELDRPEVRRVLGALVARGAADGPNTDTSSNC